MRQRLHTLRVDLVDSDFCIPRCDFRAIIQTTLYARDSHQLAFVWIDPDLSSLTIVECLAGKRIQSLLRQLHVLTRRQYEPIVSERDVDENIVSRSRHRHHCEEKRVQHWRQHATLRRTRDYIVSFRANPIDPDRKCTPLQVASNKPR